MQKVNQNKMFYVTELVELLLYAKQLSFCLEVVHLVDFFVQMNLFKFRSNNASFSIS